jgi:[ribosomal protein S5]-alanine N-acetyltransferase
MILLQTKRLTLRDIEPSDCPIIFEFANDGSISRHLRFGSISSESGTQEYVAKAMAARDASPRLSYKLAMSIKPLTKMAGSCWMDIEDPQSRNASIGYFVEQRHWNKGYATEMLRALVQFGFEELQLHRIYGNCDAENPATRRVLEKVGMRQEGLLRQHCLRSYGWADVCFYGILRSEWPPR